MSFRRAGSSGQSKPGADGADRRRARRPALPPWLGGLLGAASVLWASAAYGAEATFAWDPVVDAEGYRLYYDTDDIDPPYDGDQANEGPSPVDVPVAGLADPDAPEVTLSGLPSCTHFYFAITAYNQAGESDYGVPIEATIVASPDPVTLSPDAPSSLLVAWPGLPGDDDGAIPSYRIHFDLDSGEPYEGPGSPVDVQTSTLSDPANPSHLLTGLTNGTTYYVAVESRCDDDAGNLSDEAEGVPQAESTGGTGGTGTGGTGTGGTGTAASGGAGASSAAEPGDADEDGSCGCRTVGATDAPARWLLLPAMVLLATRRRRQR